VRELTRKLLTLPPAACSKHLVRVAEVPEVVVSTFRITCKKPLFWNDNDSERILPHVTQLEQRRAPMRQPLWKPLYICATLV